MTLVSDTMLKAVLPVALLVSKFVCGSERQFSVNDDIFAFPQYEVVFSESYITESAASKKLSYKQLRQEVNHLDKSGDAVSPESSWYHAPPEESEDEDYEVMTAHGSQYLCTIPIVNPMEHNETQEETGEAELQKELARAADRGRELLNGMEGKQCLFYSTGWWTYSFCYNSQVRQFHALSPGQTGGRVWPPQEDPTAPAFVLGRFDQKTTKEPSAPGKQSQGTDVAVLQSKSETSYLVQRLDGGTACDLTGKKRNVEVQFHCNPQLTDRIGWIKETATCSYLMVVYTPRLCNDVAFLPPKETRAYTINCQEILTDNQIPEWEARKEVEASRKLIDQAEQQLLKVGDVEIGAMNFVGKDGKRIERGRIVMTQEEKAETIVMQKDGQISSLSQSDLKKLQLKPDEIESFKQRLQEVAGSKDWKIERIDAQNGQVQLRGIVETDEEDEKAGTAKDPATNEDEATSDGDESGSEEEYKDDL